MVTVGRYSMLYERNQDSLSPLQAEDVIVKSSGKRYDSMVVDAFVEAFGQRAQGAGA
jgi:HD-GYP domain-containing protein (c-di-GMP phosphodiesterase class II)